MHDHHRSNDRSSDKAKQRPKRKDKLLLRIDKFGLGCSNARHLGLLLQQRCPFTVAIVAVIGVIVIIIIVIIIVIISIVVVVAIHRQS